MRLALLTPLLLLLMSAGTPPATAGVTADAGSYLAGRSAFKANDYGAAAEHFAEALASDPANLALLESAGAAFLSLGDLEGAARVMERIRASGDSSQAASLVLLGKAAQDNDWTGLLDALAGGLSVGPLFDSLARPWAKFGAGRMTEALAAFDEVAESGNESTRIFGLYHKALALASAGDFEGAAHILSGDAGLVLRLPRRGIVAYAEVLSQLQRNGDALDLVAQGRDSLLGDPYLEDLRARLEAGLTIPFSIARNAEDGLAEVYYSIASVLRQEPQRGYTLLYARMAAALRPGHIDALLLAAALLEQLGQHGLAIEIYDQVPRDHPEFHAAALGRAEALRQTGEEDAAIEVLQRLAESSAHLLQAHVALGDLLRELDRFEESKAPYDRAISMIDEPAERHWIIYFTRGVAHERTGEWDQAEADFRKALELRPDQPTVLNYLGYSLLERQTHLEEALALIRRAIEQRPDAGHIIDSLGWGLYRLGRHEEAVKHMERAAERLPTDPIVNDHLGDVYWAVGRHREAEFQWHRALSFITDETDPSDVDPERIRRKLEIGLDAVLAEEGAPPLDVANDGG